MGQTYGVRHAKLGIYGVGYGDTHGVIPSGNGIHTECDRHSGIHTV